MVRAIQGLREIAADYDAYMIDQFGVLHDGRRPFAGARAALTALRHRGARVAVISNSGKLAAANRKRLAGLGFTAEMFDAVVTSGELGRALLQDWLARGVLAAGVGAQIVSRDDDRGLIEGLALAEVAAPEATPEAVGFLLIAGPAAPHQKSALTEAHLAELARRRVPCLCINPDIRVYTEAGVEHGPGALAKRYAALGGAVTWIGKPQPAIFEAARTALGDPPPARTLVIGDSPEHDLAGAEAIGCPWLYVTGGVYARDAEAALAETKGLRQTGCAIPALAW